MQLFIIRPYTSINPTLVVNVDSPSDTTVYELRQRIIMKDSRIPHNFYLRGLTGHRLSDNDIISSCNIHNMTTLYCIPVYKNTMIRN